MKSISNKKIDGDFFNPGSSKAETASIVIEKSKVSIFKGEERLYHLLKVQSVQNEKSIFLENGILFVTKEKLNEIDLKLLIPKNEFLLQNLDKFKLKNVLIILLIIVMLVIGYRYLFISFSSTLVYLFPHNWEKKLVNQLIKLFRKHCLKNQNYQKKNN